MLSSFSYGCGIWYVESTTSSEATQTQSDIESKKQEIEQAIEELKKEINTNSKCGLEKLKLLTGIMVLYERALIDRKKFLNDLKNRKQELLTKKLKNTKGEKDEEAK